MPDWRNVQLGKLHLIICPWKAAVFRVSLSCSYCLTMRQMSKYIFTSPVCSFVITVNWLLLTNKLLSKCRATVPAEHATIWLQPVLFSQISNWEHQLLCWHTSILLDLQSQEFRIIDKASDKLLSPSIHRGKLMNIIVWSVLPMVTFQVWAADTKSPALTTNLTALLFNWFTNTSTNLLRQTYQFAVDFLRQKDRVLL